MIIVETCPKCGHALRDLIICTNPAIPRKECNCCGWSWEGKSEEIVYVPFGGNSASPSSNDYTLLNGYNSNNTTSNFSQSACLCCPSNPKNGGDGICFCTLGQINVVY